MSEITDAIIKELRAQTAGKEARLAHGSSEAYLCEGIDRLKRILAAERASRQAAAARPRESEAVRQGARRVARPLMGEEAVQAPRPLNVTIAPRRGRERGSSHARSSMQLPGARMLRVIAHLGCSA
jgi:hypothetical protein